MASHFSSTALRIVPGSLSAPRLHTWEHRVGQDSEPHRIIPLAFAAALGEYLERIRDLGAMEGHSGSVELNPTLRPVMEALHHVLAGGEVEVRVVLEGQADLVRELAQRAARATAETYALHPQFELPVDTAV